MRLPAAFATQRSPCASNATAVGPLSDVSNAVNVIDGSGVPVVVRLAESKATTVLETRLGIHSFPELSNAMRAGPSNAIPLRITAGLRAPLAVSCVGVQLDDRSTVIVCYP